MNNDDQHPLPGAPPRAEEPRLARNMSGFSSFAISMSTICILSGGITSFHVGFCSVGPAAIGIGWLVEVLFALAVALTMAQVASAFPTAGGTYHWAYTLGGKGWGWTTACFSIAGLVTALAAVDLGLVRFVDSVASEFLETNSHPWVEAVAVILIIFSQAFINHYGMRLTTLLNDFAGHFIIVVAVALTASLVIFGILKTGFDPARLFTFTNYSGQPRGDNPVYAPTDNIFWLFALGLLLPAYTLTGFDAAAQTSEETVNPTHAVPRGIVRAVLISGLAGWIVLGTVVLAAPDLDRAAGMGDKCFYCIIGDALPSWRLRLPLYAGLAVAQYLCGLAVVTSVSRMAYAFARDGGLPASRFLRRISPVRRTPSLAIWTVAAAAVFFAVIVGYDTIAAVCAIYVYLSYVLPTLLGLLAHGRTWTRMGPWHLGRWYRPLALMCVLGCAGLIVIGLQPPNDDVPPWLAPGVVGGSMLALAGVWFGYKRRHFPGPPAEILAQLRAEE